MVWNPCMTAARWIDLVELLRAFFTVRIVYVSHVRFFLAPLLVPIPVPALTFEVEVACLVLFLGLAFLGVTGSGEDEPTDEFIVVRLDDLRTAG